MDQVLSRLPRAVNENVLVGFDTADDAGVYKLTPECALVQTVDFFTPIVDDPHTFGAIAAANALSDVYAMGAKPLTALSIVAYPAQQDIEDLDAILLGGAAKMSEAECVILGGHSVSDDEIKFGYSVTGLVHPDRVKTNAGARAGDVLLSTKRLGTGVISTALKQGIAREEDVRASVASMLALNRAAAESMAEVDTHGCTDITGFGLIGHAREMAQASGVTLEIDTSRVRFLPGALEYARRKAVAGGLIHNRDYFKCDVERAAPVPQAVETLLYDPQTSGGLLLSMPPAGADWFERVCDDAHRIGRVMERGRKALRLI
ncbi:MAG: selenide, water dikinase SelD [Bryobacterales bacterium]|nr:selenide, water dikinase SelD [Bryobacterales bacterium]